MSTLPPLPAEPRPGRYRHYKGNEYRVVGLVRHSETLEVLVLYQALYGDTTALTEASRAGATIAKMQEVSRHKKVEVLLGYVRSAELFDDHAGEGFL